MDLLIQLASPILTAIMAVGGAYIAFNNRLTILETKGDMSPEQKQGEEHINERLAIIETKLDSLGDEVRKHNGVMERTYKLEARVDSLEARR